MTCVFVAGAYANLAREVAPKSSVVLDIHLCSEYEVGPYSHPLRLGNGKDFPPAPVNFTVRLPWKFERRSAGSKCDVLWIPSDARLPEDLAAVAFYYIYAQKVTIKVPLRRKLQPDM